MFLHIQMATRAVCDIGHGRDTDVLRTSWLLLQLLGAATTHARYVAAASLIADPSHRIIHHAEAHYGKRCVEIEKEMILKLRNIALKP
jgi:hypothetical protein